MPPADMDGAVAGRVVYGIGAAERCLVSASRPSGGGMNEGDEVDVAEEDDGGAENR